MLLNRESLKGLFKKGKFPSEQSFTHLIDSSINKLDDGISKTPDDGLQLAPQGSFDRVLSVFERMDQDQPAWQLKFLRDANAKGLSFDKVEKDENNEPISESRFFLADDGRIGIKTTDPFTPFHIKTTAGIQSRIGTHCYGKVPGDGEWHTIIGGLTGVQCLEVVARIDGPFGHGKYAITHAVALSSFGGKHARNRIKQTRSYYGWFWNRIELKWEGEIKNYALKVRTRQHYGKQEDGSSSMIRLHVTNLWDDEVMRLERLRLLGADGL